MRQAGLSAALLALVAACWAPAAGQDQAAAKQYAGSELCAVCHEDLSRDFRRNPHFPLETTAKAGAWKGRGCESCHGPGQQHAETAEGARIFSFRRATRQQANEACLACHAGEQTQRGRLQGAHHRNSLSCVECHSVHQAKAPRLLTTQTDTLCSGCHADVRAAFRRPFRHRVPERAMSCVDCHNPHGELPPSDLRRVMGNEVACFRCHSDKRGPFPFEHAPVRLSNCSTCHEPHGSANPRMLIRAEVSRLCLECHSNLPMNRLGGVPPAFHDLRTARFQNCTICHSKIHGSYVDRDFLR
jgi:DmsE family decaheme c-type cytochrome